LRLAAGVAFGDTMRRAGKIRGVKFPFSAKPGYEIAGMVEKSGAGVTLQEFFPKAAKNALIIDFADLPNSHLVVFSYSDSFQHTRMNSQKGVCRMTSRRWIAPLFVILFAFALFLQSVSFPSSKQADAAPVAALPLASTTDCPTELFFSEYIEGSSNNKALEIYNGSGADITFTGGNYTVGLFPNGSSTIGNRDTLLLIST